MQLECLLCWLMRLMGCFLVFQRIEYGCIQDLMHAAVHAQRTGVFSMAARLRMV